VEQAAAAAESLEEQAQQMVQVVTRFKLEENGAVHKVESETRVRRTETVQLKKAAATVGRGAPKTQKKICAPSVLPKTKVSEQDDDWQEF